MGSGLPFVLGVGTLEPRKNLKTLLEAFALLPSRLANPFQLVLAGKPGWGTMNLERYLQSYGPFQLGPDRLRF